MRIFFRADGSSTMGLGHIYRSCALAGLLKPDFACVFAARNLPEALRPTVLSYCDEIVDLPEVETLTAEAAAFSELLQSGDIAVLDGYHFDEAYQRTVKSRKGCRLVCIDDIHEVRFLADAVINHAGGFEPADYHAAFYTEFFLGPKYALLRPEFFEPATAEVGDGDASLLVCLGGADPNNNTLEVARRALEASFDRIHILVGAAYAHYTSLQNAVAAAGDRIQLHRNLPVDDVLALMRRCSHAVLSPSSVSYEYMAVGNGGLFLLQIAENQSRIRRFCLEEGLALDAGELRVLTPAQRATLQHVQQRYFDGQAPHRLRNLFKGQALAATLAVRPATAADVQLTYDWANDPQARRMSFSTEPIPFENHQQWFQARISSDTCRYYILERDGEPVGQIRFDAKDGEQVLSFSVAPAWRGFGLGPKLLAEGMKRLSADLSRDLIVSGYVRHENSASCQSFERLGFQRTDTSDYPDSYKYTISVEHGI